MNNFDRAFWSVAMVLEWSADPDAVARLRDAAEDGAVKISGLEDGERRYIEPLKWCDYVIWFDGDEWVAGSPGRNTRFVEFEEPVRSDIAVYPGGITYVDLEYDERLRARRPSAEFTALRVDRGGVLAIWPRDGRDGQPAYTGSGGRPSKSRALLLTEYDRRKSAGLAQRTRIAEANALITWLVETHPGAEVPTPKSLTNTIRTHEQRHKTEGIK